MAHTSEIVGSQDPFLRLNNLLGWFTELRKTLISCTTLFKRIMLQNIQIKKMHRTRHVWADSA
jgi:hypothetical protein